VKRIFAVAGLAVGACMMFTAFVGVGAAMALDSNFDAMSKPGKHQFYVWCTGKADYTEAMEGKDAKDAQAKLAAKAGNTCWPVWQGLAG